ncbi:MAG: triose-phosphate isomerase [Bacteroidales bacterium]|nr:triose-phosphate isomerase [Bacteroidales bacterium]MDZ4205542.1 triose-phosphate isomerase [Bacteroidales bacterium]
MRGRIVAGNWKMNKTFEEAEDLLYEIAESLTEEDLEKATVVICPPSPYLEMAHDVAKENGFYTGAQNMSNKESGAFTGEISAAMISSVGAAFVIVGHSERRAYFGETDELLCEKVEIALKNNLVPVFCCGERLEERNAGAHFAVVKKQVQTALFNLGDEDFSKVVIAYEPVWAIGTGVNATPEQAQEMHNFIRNLVAEKFGKKMAEEKIILYGGSCNATNASALFAQPDVDGGLIGGASLKASEFLGIIRGFDK